MKTPKETLSEITAKIDHHVDDIAKEYVDQVPIDMGRWYARKLLTHIEAVKTAGRMLGINETQLLIHDSSKFLEQEFVPYARYFHHQEFNSFSIEPVIGVVRKDFNTAWLHHLHRNPHHWQHWLMPVTNDPQKMPENYALEMIADWMGAGLAYTATWDMTDWLKENFNEKVSPHLHDMTRIFVMEKLIDLGYAEAIYGE